MSKLNFFVGGRYDSGDDDDESCEDEDSHCGEGQTATPSDADSEEVSDLEKLKSLRKKFNLKFKSERLEFLEQFKTLIRKWKDEFPNLRDIFRPREIDRLLADTTLSHAKYQITQDPFIDFVIDTGYKDEPKLDEDGKPILRHTTALHHAAVNLARDVIADLFQIYDRYDANYVDKYGLTHFHVACKHGCENAVENFLKLGQDPNLLVSRTRDSPLHFALTSYSHDIVRMLLRQGADPNLANENGSTPLHIIGQYPAYDDIEVPFFEECDEQNRQVQLDAQDKLGNTPLHLVFNEQSYENMLVAELLLRRGASPNLVNEEGSTPLHIICKEYRWDYAIDMFFEVCDEKNHVVQVDARDKSGCTPLQLAVASLSPDTIDALLDRGADLSSFVFPNVSHFNKLRRSFWYRVWTDLKLTLTAGTLAVVERLEKRGYKLDRSGALTIMKLIVQHECLAESLDFEKFWYNDEFISTAKEIMMTPSLSVYDLIRLQPEEAAKRLKYTDFYSLERLDEWNKFIHAREFSLAKANCTVYLCEKLWRRFFRRWALDSFLELTRHRLPILCCEIIFDELMNKDLYHTFLATVD